MVAEQKEGKLLHVYKTDKDMQIHSVSECFDQENFISADEGRINMFNLERKNDPIYSLIDYERRSSTSEDEVIKFMTTNT